MISPKEKAVELFDKFMKPIDELHKYPMCFSTAKQCALIAVDEVLKYSKAHGFIGLTEYYEEVKKEIQNI
jgi:hypothetical protein